MCVSLTVDSQIKQFQFNSKCHKAKPKSKSPHRNSAKQMQMIDNNKYNKNTHECTRTQKHMYAFVCLCAYVHSLRFTEVYSYGFICIYILDVQ